MDTHYQYTRLWTSSTMWFAVLLLGGKPIISMQVVQGLGLGAWHGNVIMDTQELLIRKQLQLSLHLIPCGKIKLLHSFCFQMKKEKFQGECNKFPGIMSPIHCGAGLRTRGLRNYLETLKKILVQMWTCPTPILIHWKNMISHYN